MSDISVGRVMMMSAMSAARPCQRAQTRGGDATGQKHSAFAKKKCGLAGVPENGLWGEATSEKKTEKNAIPFHVEKRFDQVDIRRTPINDC